MIDLQYFSTDSIDVLIELEVDAYVVLEGINGDCFIGFCGGKVVIGLEGVAFGRANIGDNAFC